VAAAVLLAAAALAAWLGAGYFGHELIAQIAILAILAMSLDLLVGFAGMVSLGHAAVYGLGAYATAGFDVMLGWPAAAATAAAVTVGAGAALIVGAFAVRVTGVFFIMVTLAVGEALHAFLFRSRAFGGDDGMGGIARPDLTAIGVDLEDPAWFSLYALVAAALVYLLLEGIVRSPFGRLLAAIRLNAGRIGALGCPVGRYRLAAFTLAGALAALAGSLSAQHNAFISPELLTWTVSGQALIVVIVGGLGSLAGPAAGAAVIVLATHYLSGLTDYWMMAMGLFFIAVVLFAGGGLHGFVDAARRRWSNASN